MLSRLSTTIVEQEARRESSGKQLLKGAAL